MKTYLRSLFIGLALLVGVFSVQAQVTLGIAQSNNLSVLSWPTNGSDFVLQSTTNLVSTNWLTVTNPSPSIVGTNFTVSLVGSNKARFFRLYNTNAVAIPPGMVLIPAGVFTIGDTLDGEFDAIPTVNVTVSAFYMDMNLVSSNQWAEIYSYATSHGYTFDNAGAGKTTNNPVQTVDWYDCVKWSNARSQQAGLTPVYYTDTNLTQIYTSGDTDSVYASWTNNGYRLPTEAEWEKAARAGLSGQRFPWGLTISEAQANYEGFTNSYSYDLGPNGYNSIGLLGGTPDTSPVGSFPANGYGLNDMAGNVFEWCWDWYAPPAYPSGSPYLGGTDPRGPDSSPYGLRVLRGGSWGYGASFARCANRYSYTPGSTSDLLGFRCVRGL
jgi:formylglycine-generating enzyme required for sulfatase activity